MNKKNFGTAPVFFTAIATILGAILFLRFGFAVGSVGFWGVILIIFLGHLVTIPTALAISELATNKRVEGGGEYFIISRSFGLNIGATIGLALYMSQAISVAFYIIAFTESFEFLFNYLQDQGVWLPRQAISIPSMLLLSWLIVKRGANMGVKALYVVIAILFISLIMFFAGKTVYSQTHHATFQFLNPDRFFVIFAIIFPAFTGMTAGVGLSGELKNPARSIPLGTILATLTGMIVYVLVVYKLNISASREDLINHQLIMSRIAIGGKFIIPLGLAASTISSALGSIMVAPRTLQALALDDAFPSNKLNRWLSTNREKDGEPIHATWVTIIIAFIFISLGDVNAVAKIISMFFMVTYGSLCLISFLHHFGASPSYRPTFKSRWYISLVGFAIALWVMFKINTFYAFLSLILISLIYILISNYHKNRKGLESIFANTIFQVSRNLQVYLQKTRVNRKYSEWRPSAICISDKSFQRFSAFQLLNWISYRFGFGTYIHLINGYYSRATHQEAIDSLEKLLSKYEKIANQVYIDTLISPSYTSAIAQTIQLPGIAGMENNMIIFEFDRDKRAGLEDIVENFSLVKSGDFDVCILGSSITGFDTHQDIHVWIKSTDENNANLMILLSFIISGHPDWKKSNIKIFETCKEEDYQTTYRDAEELVARGRLPITMKNIEIIIEKEDQNIKSIIKEYSQSAGLILLGFHKDAIKNDPQLFSGYDGLCNIVWVNSSRKIMVE